MTQYKISWAGNGDNPETFDDVYDTDVLTLAEAREIKKWTGLNPIQWINDMDDPDNVAAMVCMLRRRLGESELRFSDVDFNYRSFNVTLVVDEDVEPDPQPADSN